MICCFILLFLAGCATVLTGFNQNVDINSNPVKARVTVNDQYKGETPLTVRLRRNKNNVVRIELDGYEPYEIVTKKGFNAVSLGNIMIGGAVGMLVDLATGGIFTVNPDLIYAKMKSTTGEEQTIGLGVVDEIPEEVRPSLTKVGQLTIEERIERLEGKMGR